MRIPLKKLYRAFSELDRFTDMQCELLLRRVHLDATARLLVTGVPVTAFAASFVTLIIVFATTDVAAGAEHLAPHGDILVGLLSVLGIPPFTGLLLRDQLLRYSLVKAIRLRIERVRCRHCRYILIGQRPRQGLVRCPECGQANYLRALGVTANDFVPPTSELEFLSSEVRAHHRGA